jgi:hypothetical protein
LGGQHQHLQDRDSDDRDGQSSPTTCARPSPRWTQHGAQVLTTPPRQAHPDHRVRVAQKGVFCMGASQTLAFPPHMTSALSSTPTFPPPPPFSLFPSPGSQHSSSAVLLPKEVQVGDPSSSCCTYHYDELSHVEGVQGGCGESGAHRSCDRQGKEHTQLHMLEPVKDVDECTRTLLKSTTQGNRFLVHD